MTHKKKDMADVKKFEINVAVGNGQKMKCELKGLLNMKIQGGEMVMLTKVLYVPQAVQNLLSVPRIVSKGSTIGDNQERQP